MRTKYNVPFTLGDPQIYTLLVVAEDHYTTLYPFTYARLIIPPHPATVSHFIH